MLGTNGFRAQKTKGYRAMEEKLGSYICMWHGVPRDAEQEYSWT